MRYAVPMAIIGVLVLASPASAGVSLNVINYTAGEITVEAGEATT